MQMMYWCNLNLREKYFGYKVTDELVYVGSLDADNLDDMYRKCNRISEDEPTPMIDEARAPSMSVGDVVQIQNFIPGEDSRWYSVASAGFEKIEEPSELLRLRPRPRVTVGEVISGTVDKINREGR